MKPLEASKWLKFQILIDSDEMDDLFCFLSDFYLFITGSVCKIGEEEVSKDQFSQKYKHYIESLKQGNTPDLNLFRTFFSTVLTAQKDFVYSIPLKEDKHMMRVCYPCIQLQAHQMNVQDGKFRPMVFGIDNILWGIQFSYPQLFFDPETNEVRHTMKETNYPNTELFRKLQSWIRKNTTPTPFIINGNIVNSPIRIGKNCFSWIANHPQLKKKNIQVSRAEND